MASFLSGSFQFSFRVRRGKEKWRFIFPLELQSEIETCPLQNGNRIEKRKFSQFSSFSFSSYFFSFSLTGIPASFSRAIEWSFYFLPGIRELLRCKKERKKEWKCVRKKYSVTVLKRCFSETSFQPTTHQRFTLAP